MGLATSIFPKAVPEHIGIDGNQPADTNTLSHRHASPSAPWPWIDLEDDVNSDQLESSSPPIPKPCDHTTCHGECWRKYPQSRFPNWTKLQIKKSKIEEATGWCTCCTIYVVDVNQGGIFTNPGALVRGENDKEKIWTEIIQIKPSKDYRVKVLFLENMSGAVMQMLGEKYNIEPFFFSSSLNWIPSRYQEEVRPKQGDHITITLTYLRSSCKEGDGTSTSSAATLSTSGSDFVANQMIDTREPLFLGKKRALVLGLLSVHLIRDITGSTIISYHPQNAAHSRTITAEHLHKRIQLAGKSVYWETIFQRVRDPTFVLLLFLWHAMYAWDEALEHLYTHICSLESRVLDHSEVPLTQELHIIRAHLLYYSSLLEDFRKTVNFVRDTRNPALDAFPEDPKFSENLMVRECDNLVSEVGRLEMGRRMQEKRLKNVMNLVFSRVNIELTEVALRDSAGTCPDMKQIAYLTMIFLPASFVAAAFGMNIKEIVPETHGTLPHYLLTAIPLTVVTVWMIIAFQSQYLFKGKPFWKRLGWPVLLVKSLFKRGNRRPSSVSGLPC